MKAIRVKPIEIIGECPLGISFKDEFIIENLGIKNPKKSKLCFLAISHLYYGIWGIQNNQVLVNHSSCPGCTNDLESENRISFLIAFPENWKLGEKITKYYEIIQQIDEPEDARKLRLKAEACLVGEKINSELALKGIKMATKIIKSCNHKEPKIQVI